jgi:beta-N-acetylhexosaminidase
VTITLEEKIGQMLVVGFHGHEPPPHILDWLKEGRIGGVILFSRNIETPQQVSDLTDRLHRAARRPILVAIDQEGGVVSRLREGFTESPGAMALGAADDPKLTEEVSAVLATEMRALGINWNLAPAIDLTHDIRNPSVGVRSLGSDPLHVSRHALAQVRGLQGAGVAATAKHFPGKANTPVDPHVTLPVIEGPLGDMWDTDLVPFRAVCDAGVAAVMITHVQFKALEPLYPSTLSQAIIQGLLRRDMGYRGLVTTDCMEMKAVTDAYGPGESAVLAARAGANVVLFSHTKKYQEAAYDALQDAVRTGRLPVEKVDYSVARINEVKRRFASGKRPPLKVIRRPSHLETVGRAARAGTVLLMDKPCLLPLVPRARVAVIEFASSLEKEAVGQGKGTAFVKHLKDRRLSLEAVALDPSTPTGGQLDHARKLAVDADTLVLATRNAHLYPAQLEAAKALLAAGKPTVLVCLRNPYDAGALDAGTVLLALGDAAPSLEAAAEALAGSYEPAGRLRVPLKRGRGGEETI